MSRLPLMRDGAASHRVRARFEEFRRRLALDDVPNLVRVQGASHPAVDATCALVESLVLSGSLPRVLKELIMLAVSAERDCYYCQAAHTAILGVLGADRDTVLAALENLDDVAPMRTGMILRFAVRCATQPSALREEDYDRLRRHGVSDAELTEIIAIAGAAVYLNILADASEVELDEALERQAAWLMGEPPESPP